MKLKYISGKKRKFTLPEIKIRTSPHHSAIADISPD